MIFNAFAPVLSAQFTTAATGKAVVVLNFKPTAPPLPIKKSNDYQ
jgi:hypothetical protein